MTRLLTNLMISAKFGLLSASLTLFFSVIAIGSSIDYRCSHVPPTPDQVTHVWLDDANSSQTNDVLISETKYTSSEDVPSSNISNDTTSYSKAKRHVNEKKESSDDLRNSLLDLFKSFQRNQATPGNDLVPMKIQVHYDHSVDLLEPQKFDLITHKVIPSVISFFENALSIRRDFTIDKFRMARRCPNNTIYHAKDIQGSSKQYCMDYCENYAICGEMIVPQAHLAACSYCNSTARRCLTDYSSEGPGVADTQLLLYVSAKQTTRCRKDQTIAYAAHCAQDAKTDRPVAGHANLCPDSISVEPKDLRALIATVKHELTHVLGFSVSLFAYYRDEEGQPLTERDSSPGPIQVDPKTGYARWSDKIIRRITRKDWVTGAGKIDKEVHLMVTPTVIREVRKQFNCSTLEGAELEDQGSDGTSMTHWEKRLFENEAMTGTHTQNSVYSRLTLAVLQDTGWYVANFSRAEKLEWGTNLGCNFAKKSCKSWIDERRAMKMSIRPFCDRVKLKGDLLQISCTEDRTSKAVCNMKYYNNSLPPAYRNFDYLDGVTKDSLAHYGGSVDLADYCPFIQEFTWQTQNITVRGSRCDIASNNLESEGNSALELYGQSAKCFEHGRRWDQRSCIYKRHWHHYGAGCYKYSCTNGHVYVTVGNHSYACYYANQVVHIEQLVDQWLYSGTLICPACEKVCASHKCKTFNKRIIDKILNSNHVSYSMLELVQENSLTSTDDDAHNSIESGNIVHPKPSLKQKSINIEDVEGVRKHNAHLLQALQLYKKPPKDTLICSNANRIMVYHELALILSIAVISLMNNLLDHNPLFMIDNFK